MKPTILTVVTLLLSALPRLSLHMAALVAFTAPISNQTTALNLESQCNTIDTNLRDGATLSPAEFSKLSTRQMVELLSQKFSNQVGGWRAQDISNLMRNIPPKYQNQARDLIYRLTRFGNMEAMFKFAEQLPEYIEGQRLELLTFSEGTVLDTVQYLQVKSGQSKKSRMGKWSHAGRKMDPSKSQAILIDAATLEIIQSNPSIQKAIIKHKMKLIVIPGLAEGVHILNQGNKNTISDKLLKYVVEVNQNGQRDPDSIISRLTVEKLKTMGLESNILMWKYDNGPISTPSSMSDVFLAERVSPKRITTQQLLTAFANMPKSQKRRMLITFYQEAVLLSTSSMFETSKRIHEEVKEHVSNRGVTESELYYVAPIPGKSYNTVLGIYIEANQIPRHQILRPPLSPQLVKGKTVVVIDDIAGSGDSIREMGKIITRHGGHPILGTHIGTEAAIKNLASRNFTFVVGEKLRDFRESEYFNALQEFEKSEYDEHYVGGYGGHTKVAFEHMSPNNNVKTFTRTIAPLYTLRKAAIKDE